MTAPATRRFAALESFNFRLYAVGLTLSFSGTWFQRVAQAWLVLDLTGSPAALGTVTAMQYLPQMLLIPAAGVLADRLSKRKLIRFFQASTLLQSSVFAALILSGQIQLWHVYILAGLLGIATSVDNTARTSFIGEMVDRHQVQSAVSLNSALGNLARVLGPAIAGVVIAISGVGWCFVLNALLQAMALGSLTLMRTRDLRPSQPPARASVATQLVDGVQYVRSVPLLLIPLLFQGAVGAFLLNWQVVLPLIARYSLDVGSVGLGAMSGALGIGAVLGSMVTAGSGAPKPRYLLVVGGLFSLAFAALGLSPTFTAAMVLLLAIGVIQILFNASAQTMLQLNANPSYRGRVLSLWALAVAGSTPIGSAFIGGLADIWDVRSAIVTASAVCLACLLGTWVLLRARLAPSPA